MQTIELILKDDEKQKTVVDIHQNGRLVFNLVDKQGPVEKATAIDIAGGVLEYGQYVGHRLVSSYDRVWLVLVLTRHVFVYTTEGVCVARGKHGLDPLTVLSGAVAQSPEGRIYAVLTDAGLLYIRDTAVHSFDLKFDLGLTPKILAVQFNDDIAGVQVAVNDVIIDYTLSIPEISIKEVTVNRRLGQDAVFDVA